ncbi:MAG TPA: leucyl/phenylalanyl-tRNA--protein transferase, partial [Acidimicrobiia bacterium]
MPVEPMPSRFDLPTPADDDGDVVAVGADLAPGTLLQAYRKGMFPMNLPDGHLGWWSPVERAILPLGGLKVSRSLKKSVRRFTVTVDEDFEAVVAGCADPEREGAWITPEFVEAYVELNRLGWAHSIEVWDADGDLAGGLYGLAIGGLFAGESMFHRVRDASKVALFHLVVIMSQGGG